jgi:lysophospholipase L1-like esterase
MAEKEDKNKKNDGFGLTGIFGDAANGGGMMSFLIAIFSGKLDLSSMLNSFLTEIGMNSAPGNAPGRQSGASSAHTTTMPSQDTGAAAGAIPIAPAVTAAPSTLHVKAGNGIVTYGDSLALGDGNALSRQFQNVTNMGIGGAGLLNTKTPLASLDGVDLHNKTVLVSVGTNDVGFLTGKPQASMDKYEAKFSDMIGKIKADGGTPVIIGAREIEKPLSYKGRDGQTHTQTPEAMAQWNAKLGEVNQAMQKAAAAQGVAFTMPEGGVGQRAGDGVHYTNKGYTEIADNALKHAPAVPAHS